MATKSNGSIRNGRQKCYLCDLPKGAWTILSDFSQPVCRACVNYEGPARVEEVIQEATRLREMEGHSESSTHAQMDRSGASGSMMGMGDMSRSSAMAEAAQFAGMSAFGDGPGVMRSYGMAGMYGGVYSPGTSNVIMGSYGAASPDAAKYYAMSPASSSAAAEWRPGSAALKRSASVAHDNGQSQPQAKYPRRASSAADGPNKIQSNRPTLLATRLSEEAAAAKARTSAAHAQGVGGLLSPDGERLVTSSDDCQGTSTIKSVSSNGDGDSGIAMDASGRGSLSPASDKIRKPAQTVSPSPRGDSGQQSRQSTKQTPSSPSGECHSCGTSLATQQYVQCPAVDEHRYCLYCTYMHVESSGSPANGLSCPSHLSCPHPQSHVPWVFLPDEIECIRRTIQMQQRFS